MLTLVEVAGWYGAVAIVGAYLLVSFGILAADGVWYQVLNLTGAAGIVAVSWLRRAMQPAALNLIWTAIAAISLIRMIS